MLKLLKHNIILQSASFCFCSISTNNKPYIELCHILFCFGNIQYYVDVEYVYLCHIYLFIPFKMLTFKKKSEQMFPLSWARPCMCTCACLHAAVFTLHAAITLGSSHNGTLHAGEAESHTQEKSHVRARRSPAQQS